MTYDIGLIGAPSSAGAYAPGQEKAPAAFRRHGLLQALQTAGLSVFDGGDVAAFRWRPDLQRPHAMNAPQVAKVARSVAERVATAFQNAEHLLVLGGDCTIELGVVAGALERHASVGLLYIDLDVDLNAPQTSDGALDWTGVAHLLDIPGAEPELSQLATRRPMLRPSDILFFAAGEITEPEAETIARLNLPVISLEDAKSRQSRAIERALKWAQPFDCLLIHVDADVLAYTLFPIAENVRRGPGLAFDELRAILVRLVSAENFKALTLTEVNPDHAPDEREIFARLIDLLSEIAAAARSTRSAAGPSPPILDRHRRDGR